MHNFALYYKSMLFYIRRNGLYAVALALTLLSLSSKAFFQSTLRGRSICSSTILMAKKKVAELARTDNTEPEIPAGNSRFSFLYFLSLYPFRHIYLYFM